MSENNTISQIPHSPRPVGSVRDASPLNPSLQGHDAAAPVKIPSDLTTGAASFLCDKFAATLGWGSCQKFKSVKTGQDSAGGHL